MYQDEAGFGRINKPKQCWCTKGIRPRTPCQHIREYRYVYGAVAPHDGSSSFLVLPYCNTECMSLFLDHLSNEFPNRVILLAMDNASWHRSGKLKIPENIIPFPLLPYTPEMNPMEIIWKEIRMRGFRNEVFGTLEKVIDRLCHTICSLSPDIIKSITKQKWLLVGS